MRCIVLAYIFLCFFIYSARVDFQLVNQFSLFEFHWSNAVQQNSIRSQCNGLGKDQPSDETSPVFWVWARFAESIFFLPNTANYWYSVCVHGEIAKSHKTVYISVNKNMNYLYIIWDGLSLKTISSYCPFNNYVLMHKAIVVL